MLVVSWNVNGIRACLDKGFTKELKNFDADFFCVQETKACQDQVDYDRYPELTPILGPWASAQKKGYSGVATFTPHLKKVESSIQMGFPHYDSEGRANILIGKGFTLVNLYIPNGAASEERHKYKMGFLKDLIPWLKKLEKDTNPLIVCGDYNIAHTPIDIHDPVSNKDSSGFKPEERAWMTEFLNAGFMDTFRHVKGELKDQYSWWSFRQRSRERNKGWRIDYICVSSALEKKIKHAEIHPSVFGSDHCPVSLEIDV